MVVLATEERKVSVEDATYLAPRQSSPETKEAVGRRSSVLPL
jgi:hypothetical protein